MANVDDFWRQLNAKKTQKVSLSGLNNVPGLTTHTRTLPSKSVTSQASPPAPAPHASQVAATLPDQQGLQVRVCVVTTAGWQTQDHGIACWLQASLQRDINCLKDQDRTLRRNAVRISCNLLSQDTAEYWQLCCKLPCCYAGQSAAAQAVCRHPATEFAAAAGQDFACLHPFHRNPA